jgi:uncharacterized protein YyaL (SSP411 family)
LKRPGDEVIQVLQGHANVEASSTQVDWNAAFELCYRQFAAGYDARYGGFGDAPKFPRPATHDFMHRYGATNANEESGQMALQMSRHTLGAMSDGGMNDQLGGGFHRYSVDEQWIVSHFEKMLYDQAQLVISYIEMFQMTREPYFANTARNTLEYVLRDMTHPDGGFFSAEDADSLPSHTSTHKEEGAFYVWTVQELEEASARKTLPSSATFTACGPKAMRRRRAIRTASSKARAFCIWRAILPKWSGASANRRRNWWTSLRKRAPSFSLCVNSAHARIATTKSSPVGTA